MIAPGVPGVLTNERVLAVLEEQVLFAFTDKVPVLKVGAKSTVMEVPEIVTGEAPAVEVTPVGNVQV